jgi:hypothetical protein
LRFAAASFVAIVLIVGGIGFIGSQLIRRSNEHSAAETAAAIASAPLLPLFEPLGPGEPVSASTRSRAEDALRPLISGDVRAVRVWGQAAEPVLSVGTDAPAQGPSQPPAGPAWTRSTAPDGSDIFVTFARAGAYTIEVDQSSAAVNRAISKANRELISLLALFALACFVLVQLTFWLGVRRFAAGHRRRCCTRGDEIRHRSTCTQSSRTCRATPLLARGPASSRCTASTATRCSARRASRRPARSRTWRAIEVVPAPRRQNTAVTSAARPPWTFPVDGVRRMSVVCTRGAGGRRGVSVIRRSGGGFTATEVQGVEELAGQAVTAVEQALLFAKVRSYADEIEVSYDATLKALMAALDAKDEVTQGHCERVARITLHLARQMGVAESQLVDIERGALLHDVGKIGVPDAVLKKPKALNDGEWEAMRKHPLLAGLMVSKIGFLEGSLPILLYHHERYDGGGYPFGLTGDKIPLEARIFSIVDAYDAMTSDRPYRAAMSHDVAMAELAANSGLQFDPDVVEAFERLMEARPDLRHDDPHRFPAGHDDHDLDLTPASEDAA